MSVDPFVRHMVLCAGIRGSPTNPNRLDVQGLLTNLSVSDINAFPVCLPKFCVFLQLSGGRGTGSVRIDVRDADSEKVLFSSANHVVTFQSDPLAVQSLTFNINNGTFLRPGLYWVQFCYNERVLAEQPLHVRLPDHD